MEEQAEVEIHRTAFVVVIRNNRYEIGLAYEGEKGYFPDYGTFDEDITYDKACNQVDDLNESHFGLDKKEAYKIVLSSMRR